MRDEQMERLYQEIDELGQQLDRAKAKVREQDRDLEKRKSVMQRNRKTIKNLRIALRDYMKQQAAWVRECQAENLLQFTELTRMKKQLEIDRRKLEAERNPNLCQCFDDDGNPINQCMDCPR